MAKPTRPVQSNETKEHFFEVPENFDTAMLVTRPTDGSLHARPLGIAGKDPDGTLLVRDERRVASPEVEESAADERALVTMQRASRFVVVEEKAGRADVAVAERLAAPGKLQVCRRRAFTLDP